MNIEQICSSTAREYWHMLPETSQARKAIWDAVNFPVRKASDEH